MTDQQKVQLLPCPFCGGQPMKGSSYDEDVLLHNIRCRCGAGVNDFFGPEEAIDAWNTRANEAKGGEVVGWIHRQGNHSEVSERQLEPEEIARGWTQEPLYTHPAPSTEDARDAMRWRKFVSMVDPDKVPGGFNVYLAMTDDVDVWCYCEDDIAELVDQALAAERGEAE